MRAKNVLLFLAVYLTILSAIANAQLPSLTQCTDQGTWSTQNFDNNFVQLSSPLLLTDGRVMAQYISGLVNANPYQDWWALTPSITGCYSLNAADCVGGQTATWSELASLASLTKNPPYGPAGFASAVLPGGNVIIEGGEDNMRRLNRDDTNGGAYYYTASNSWAYIKAPTADGWNLIGDAPSVVLANKKFMLGNACAVFPGTGFGLTALFDEGTMTWDTSIAQPPEWTSEASFTLLPDESVMFVGTCWPGQACNSTSDSSNAFRYTNAGVWTSEGPTPEPLYSYNVPGSPEAGSCKQNWPIIGEQGPAALLPSGMYFATGGFNVASNVVFTSQYDTTTNTWTATPPLPTVTINGNSYHLTAEDQGSVVLPDGNLLMQTPAYDADDKYSGSTYYIEWNGSSYCQLTNVPGGIPGQAEMLTLPTGNILIMEVSWWRLEPSLYFIYRPEGGPYKGIGPVITSVPSTITAGTTYKITGMRFNGATQSSFFGDDFQNATNYPLVKIVNNGTNHVFYAKTHDPSTMAVATGNATVYTYFDVPASIEIGASELYVVANGIPSEKQAVTVVP